MKQNHFDEDKIYKKMYYHLFNAVTDAINAATKSEAEFKLEKIIQNSFLNGDFRQSIVKILVNPLRIHCVLCLSLTKICYSKNLRPESEDFSLDFWLLRTKKGWRLSRAKHRKALKKTSFRLFRIILANLINAQKETEDIFICGQTD